MSTLAAQPYDIHADGFFFDSLEDFEEKAAANVNEFGQPVEEYEIQFIDGDNPGLFEAAGINQATLVRWFDELEDITDEDRVIALRFLMRHCGYDLDTALEKIEEPIIFHGTAEEYVEESLEEQGLFEGLPDIIANHIDYGSIARDWNCEGDLVELKHDVWCVNVLSL